MAASYTEARADAKLEDRFAAFVGTNRDRARRLAYRLVGGDAAAAEDVAQDAFVRAYLALGRFRGEASLDTWFYRILVRQAHNYRRWRGVREAWRAARGKEEPAAPEPADPGLRDRIRDALERLPRTQREVFVLVHLEQFTVRETADLVGRAEGTVKSHLHRALRSLRAELADIHPAAPTLADAGIEAEEHAT